MKVCAEPGCPELVDAGRCAQHERAQEQQRGTKQARGYDRAYDLRRTSEARVVARGSASCWSCRERISPLEAWDLGHCDDDRSVIHGAQHRACNRDVSGFGCAHPSHRISPDA